MTFRGHDVVIRVAAGDVPVVRGLTLDGMELLVPENSTLNVGTEMDGTVTATITVFARSVRTEVQ